MGKSDLFQFIFIDFAYLMLQANVSYNLIITYIRLNTHNRGLDADNKKLDFFVSSSLSRTSF